MIWLWDRQGVGDVYRVYLFKDLYKEIIIRNPKKVGSSGLRQGRRIVLRHFYFRVWGLRFEVGLRGFGLAGLMAFTGPTPIWGGQVMWGTLLNNA